MIVGDTKQDDLTSERYNETSGLFKLIKVLKAMKYVDCVNFEIEDIVRSGFVKDFIATEERLGLT